ncbi:probable LRR receptor-like serine/threonine-protein kinase At3g47570 [Cryptomeria japonica]|uniref:probable LRR receptor-like serine/threonine-protein kinase At3g47570 n=1 Tax=Cryptomeria japonica TaxID=3369 RepID=UPI0027DA0436|nr:probable LRR receptor-like serine/threonine-protein kinase At3g47570 [Cryptomeria japonica]
MAALLLLPLMLSILLISALPHPLNNLSHHHHHQQQLLLQFKAAVSRNGTSLLDWTPIHPFCNWSGVICNSHSVHAIYLSHTNLDGTISPVLGNLSSLRSLDLSLNNLTGIIPSQLSQLPNLQTLSLYNNRLEGSIPSQLGRLPHLQILWLHKNELQGSIPPELSLLTSLEQLYLGSNSLTGTIPPSFKNLSALVVLDLVENKLYGPIPGSLGNLSALTTLSLADNHLQGHIPPELCMLARLQMLDLFKNNLSGTIPTCLTNLSNLIELKLDRNWLSGHIPWQIGTKLFNLRFLSLWENRLSGNIPNSLGNCSSLEQLYLDGNQLGGTMPVELGKIVMVQAIDISGNQLTGVIPNSLGDCTALERLNLSHNTFVGPIPDSFSKLQNLQEIDLSFNNLSGQIPEAGLFPDRTVVTFFMGNSGLCGPKNYLLPPCPNQNKDKHSLLKKIILSVVGTIAFTLCCFIIGILWRHKISGRLVRRSSFNFQRLGYPKFSYQDLAIATSGFDESNLLGVGNFGSVYKGILKDGKVVAIKALDLQNEEAEKSFRVECELLGRIRHRNLIKIISAFYYPAFKGLVLQFASNGSLEKHLYPHRDDEEFCELGLNECLSIAADVAHGMEYLHHDSPLQIVHCDLKPSNVLLDANLTALVTDFGISRLTTTNSTDSLSTITFALKGSIGYIAPEYGLGGTLSIKGDVYSFGIVILEMVTRKRPTDDMFVGDMSLQKWVRSAFPNRLVEIVDSALLRDVNENIEDNKCLISFIHVGLLCTIDSPRERPSMRNVANALENLKKSLMGDASASNLTSTISELLDNTNPTETLASDSESSTF